MISRSVTEGALTCYERCQTSYHEAFYIGIPQKPFKELSKRSYLPACSFINLAARVIRINLTMKRIFKASPDAINNTGITP